MDESLKVGETTVILDIDRFFLRARSSLGPHAPVSAGTLAGCEIWNGSSKVYRETSVGNWDGYGARAVDVETYDRAKLFLDLLPSTTPAAEVSAEPDGEISFEWRPRPWRVFTVSISPQGKLTYAGVFGSQRSTHGTEILIGQIPKAITDHLTRLFSAADP